MLINYRKEMLHDSSLYEFRDPVGALPAGMPVTLRFRTRLDNVDGVYLFLFGEGHREEYLLQQSGEYWQVQISAPVVSGVYWYYFTVKVGGKLCYYGAGGGRTGGMGCVYSAPPPAYQLTVYDPAFEVPAWFHKSVMYQIFPDRFRRSNDRTAEKGIEYHRSRGRLVFYHEKWEESPLFTPLPGEKTTPPAITSGAP